MPPCPAPCRRPPGPAAHHRCRLTTLPKHHIPSAPSGDRRAAAAAADVDAYSQCLEPIQEGPCRASVRRWGYDIEQAVCVPFEWGGCQVRSWGGGGGLPRWRALPGQCHPGSVCCPHATLRSTCPLASASPKCCRSQTATTSGPSGYACRPAGEHTAGRRCSGSTRPSCGVLVAIRHLDGPSHSLTSLPLPSRAPAPRRRAVAEAMDDAPSPCAQPKQQGTCRAFMPRWYYDAEADECRRFIYGGCGANANNFSSRRSCQAKCM